MSKVIHYDTFHKSLVNRDMFSICGHAHVRLTGDKSKVNCKRCMKILDKDMREKMIKEVLNDVKNDCDEKFIALHSKEI